MVIVWTLDVDGGKIVVNFWVLLVVVGSGRVESLLDGDGVGKVEVLIVWFITLTESIRSLDFDGGHIVVNVWTSGVDGSIVIVIVQVLLVVIGKII